MFYAFLLYFDQVAAVIIQSVMRGWKDRVGRRRHEAATKIEAVLRGKRGRTRAKQESAVRGIQVIKNNMPWSEHVGAGCQLLGYRSRNTIHRHLYITRSNHMCVWLQNQDTCIMAKNLDAKNLIGHAKHDFCLPEKHADVAKEAAVREGQRGESDTVRRQRSRLAPRVA